MTSKFPSSKLTSWFLAERRDLPWRFNPTPYRVWVSEVMLQQTQVAVVIPYFEAWMRKFPSINCLAAASLEEVIKSWEGLGYYSRARNLQEGARYLREQHEGHFPEDHTLWKKIKGLGPYTTGAIRSFAFNQKAAAVDGNVVRVLARFYDINEDISKSRTQKEIWARASEILPENTSWIHNEALIELGATVCTRKPNCCACPLKNDCLALGRGTVPLLPYNSRKSSCTHLHRLVAVIVSNGHVLVTQCGPKSIMEGLHEFPYFEMDSAQLIDEKAKAVFPAEFYDKIISQNQLLKISHSFTRYQAHLYPFIFQISEEFSMDGYKWVSFDVLSQLAFSSGHRKIYHRLSEIQNAK